MQHESSKDVEKSGIIEISREMNENDDNFVSQSVTRDSRREIFGFAWGRFHCSLSAFVSNLHTVNYARNKVSQPRWMSRSTTTTGNGAAIRIDLLRKHYSHGCRPSSSVHPSTPLDDDDEGGGERVVSTTVL